MMRSASGYSVAVDIGTANVVCAMATRGRDGALNFCGMGRSATADGMKEGVVSDIAAASAAIAQAVQSAAQMAGHKSHNACVSLSGSHLECIESRAMVRIHDSEIDGSDINEALKGAQAVPTNAQRTVLHTLPSQYLVDNRSGVRNPQGMAAVRLDVEALVVTADTNVCRNLDKVLKNGQIRNNLKVYAGICSAAAVLNSDELQRGAAVVDIGAGTTDLVVFRDGALKLMDVLPVAGDQITWDIAQSLRAKPDAAEQLKLRHGVVGQVSGSEKIEVELSNGSTKAIDRQNFAALVGASYSQILEKVCAGMQGAGIEPSSLSAIVLTGGGAKVEALRHLAEEIMHCAARVGSPKVRGQLEGVLEDPSFASVVGAMRFASESPAPFDCCFDDASLSGRRSASVSRPGWWGAVRNWLKENY